MARNKDTPGCMTMLFFWPFYFIWICMKYTFIFVFWFVVESFKFLYNLYKELTATGRKKHKGITGHDYEEIAADYLRQNGYSNVKVTRASGDFGVDITAHKGFDKWAVQCKYYSNPVGVSAIQEVVGGMAHYGCNKAMVITNNIYTEPAKKLARENGVILKSRIDYNSKNPLITLRNIIMIFTGLCTIGIIGTITGSGISGIEPQYRKPYLILVIIFCVSLVSYIIPKIILRINFYRLQHQVKHVSQQLDDFENSIKSRRI